MYLSWFCCWLGSLGVSLAICLLAFSPDAAVASNPSTADTQTQGEIYFLIIIFHAWLRLNYSAEYILSVNIQNLSFSLNHREYIYNWTKPPWRPPFFAQLWRYGRHHVGQKRSDAAQHWHPFMQSHDAIGSFGYQSFRLVISNMDNI